MGISATDVAMENNKMLIRKVKLLGTTLGHALVLGCLVALPVVSAQAGSHTWDVNEIFSDVTGTIQFIELIEAGPPPGAESAVPGHTMSTTTDTVGFPIIGPAVAPPTSGKHYLIGTAAFAALTGAPPLDATFDPGSLPFFFTAGADSVSYEPWDTLTYGAGVLPTDGVTSLNADLSTGVNSPTNSLGASGSVNVSGGSSEIPVLSEWGLILFALLLLAVVARYGIRRPATS